MVQATFCYEGLRTRVTLESEEDLGWLNEFLLPSFDSSRERPAIEVQVNHDPQQFDDLMARGPTGEIINAFMMDTKVIAFPIWNSLKGQLAFFDKKHELFYLISGSEVGLIFKNRDSSRRMPIMRVLRELAMGVSHAKGARFLHASSFDLNGQAAIIAGPRRAGKTSLLSYILSNSQAAFISNDRLLIKPGEESISLRGMPTIVSIRGGTINLLPAMREQIQERGIKAKTAAQHSQEPHHSESGYRQQVDSNARYGLSPLKYCELLNCNASAGATAKLILLPSQTGLPGGLEIRPLGISHTRERLKDCLFGNIGPDRQSDAFTLIPPQLGEEINLSDAELRSTLANTIPAYECLLGNDSYNDSAAAMQIETLLRKLCARSLNQSPG